MDHKKAITPKKLLFVFIGIYLIVGFLISPDFGRAQDERHEEMRSGLALSIYLGEEYDNLGQAYDSIGARQFYGTASTVLIRLVEKFLFPNIDHTTKTVAHFAEFVFFLAAIILIFYLSLNFFDGWVSLVVALLFGTQPLFFGHAFINPKDIPLLTMFLLSIVTGFRMVDGWGKIGTTAEGEAQKKNVKKTILMVWTPLLVFFVIFWFRAQITDLFLYLVDYGYRTSGTTVIGRLFSAFTTSGSLTGYRILANRLLSNAYRIFVLVSPLLLFLIFYLSDRHRLAGDFANLSLFFASAAWGFAISTRVLGIAAGGIVGLYALIKIGRKTIIPLTIYTISASLISYITWPYLWAHGLSGYINSLVTFSDFERIKPVLMNGVLYNQNSIPASFLPHMMLVQFSEMLVVLAVPGLLIGLIKIYRNPRGNIKLALLYAWFIVPILYVIFASPTIYNNFRHFFFTTPPLFIFAGLAIDQLQVWVKNSKLLILLSILIILPSSFSIVHLHPYEYIYYNQFVGGIEGAENRYRLDYWGIAYKEAVEFANENFTPGSSILMYKDDQRGEWYATKEFNFIGHTEVPESEYQNFDYAIMVTSEYQMIGNLSDYPVIFSVNAGDVSLLSILKISGIDE